ncbi:MAG: J domain-containing protein [Synechococcales bacterium]|nr:J domain-containing protein [Synechococcales bacterium]
MPKTTSKSAPKEKSSPSQTGKAIKPQKTVQLNQTLQKEVARLAEEHQIRPEVLQAFAHFVIVHYKDKDPKIKPLTLTQLKGTIYQYFSVSTTPELKKSGAFKMATDGMSDLNLSVRDGWEKLYRKFVGVLPGEENEQGYGCINGINIFKYFKPWQVFGLNPQQASQSDIKAAYYKLSKIYHPDVSQTGDAAIFDSLTTMYKSISAEI